MAVSFGSCATGRSGVSSRLPLDGVHVWRIREADEGLLSAAERERAGAMRDAQARRVFATARAGVRAIAALYTGVDAASLDLRTVADGKPYFANAEVEFNISHSGGEVVAAFSADPVGVDIERAGRRGDWAGIARRFFHPDEAEAIGSGDEFLRVWTAKEAMLKLSGRGIGGGLESARLFGEREGRLAGRAVWLQHFELKNHVGTVATFAPFEVKGWFEF